MTELEQALRERIEALERALKECCDVIQAMKDSERVLLPWKDGFVVPWKRLFTAGEAARKLLEKK